MFNSALPIRKTAFIAPQATWESALEAIPGIQRVNEDNWEVLQEILAVFDESDSYLTSLNYYLFTGRRGFWLYEDLGAILPLCWHPNVDGQIIIFPQIGQSSSDALAELLSAMPEPPAGVRLVRMQEDRSQKPLMIGKDEGSIAFIKKTEQVLDWTYPLHILSTRLVVDAVGPKFMDTRNRLRQTHKHSIKILPVDAVQHSRMIENLLHRWASHSATTTEEYDNLYSPYENLFANSMDDGRGLAGLMIIVDDVLQAISLWDVSNRNRKTANLFVNISNTEIKGLSELLIVKSCETLLAEGIEFLNLGGSETAGLDAYKRKFCPVQSLELFSMDVEYVAPIAHASNSDDLDVA